MAKARMTLKKAKQIVLNTPHSSICARGSKDTYEAVYGKPDPDCPNCKALEFARNQMAARMFA